jgi:glycosyltransferase involved in cell wall biosynthesis
MHIGIVVYGDLSRTSGGYLYDRNVVEYLRERGDRVTVFSQPERPYPAGLIDTFDIRFWKDLATAPLDVLLQDELNHPSLAIGNYWLRRVTEVPIVSIVHHLRASERRSRIDTLISRRLERLYLQSVHGFVYNSRTTRRAVRELLDAEVPPRPSTVAPPSGHRFEDPPTEAAVAARARREGPLRLAFVGNVIPRKRLHLVVEGLARAETQDWRLDVVGDLTKRPDYVDRIRRSIDRLALDQRIMLHGRVPDDDLHRFLDRSHALAVPSAYEGYGIVYVEAMGHGLPVIASPHGGVREVVEAGRTGAFVRSASEIASTVDRWASDRDALAAMARNALRAYREFPTWTATVRRVAGFLDDLVASHATAASGA